MMWCIVKGFREQNIFRNSFLHDEGFLTEFKTSLFGNCFDTPSCENTNGVYTSVIPIKNDTSQGNQDYEPDENVYNTIQTNLNCFGGYRGLLSKQLMS